MIDLGKKLSPAAADSQEQVIGIDLEELEECLKKTVRPSSGSGVNNSSNDDTSAKTAAIVSVSFGEVNTVSLKQAPLITGFSTSYPLFLSSYLYLYPM